MNCGLYFESFGAYTEAAVTLFYSATGMEKTEKNSSMNY